MKMNFGQARNGAQQDILNAGLRRRGDGDGVAIAASGPR